MTGCLSNQMDATRYDNSELDSTECGDGIEE